MLFAVGLAIFLYTLTMGLLLQRQAAADSGEEAAFIKLDLRADNDPNVAATSPVEKIIRDG